MVNILTFNHTTCLEFIEKYYLIGIALLVIVVVVVLKANLSKDCQHLTIPKQAQAAFRHHLFA